jgi:uncharacterized protein YkwD
LAAVVLSLGSGGFLAHLYGIGSGVATLTAIGADDARGIDTRSVLTAVQPAPSMLPSARPSTKATSTATPTPTTVAPKPTATKPKPPKKTTPPANQSTVDKLLAQINDLRAQHDLPAYTLLSGLNASAHKHNLTMMGGCGLSHQCSGEAAVGDRISAQGVHWNACGENIGYSGPHPNTASAMVSAAEGLTTSMYNEKPPDDGHRLNLLSSQFHHIGIDVTRDSSGKVWLTQDFSN